MADQRQPFRFRLPWQSVTSSQPPPPTESQPSRPAPEIQTPAQAATAVPFQRPPFRPVGMAPAVPPPQRTEPQLPSSQFRTSTELLQATPEPEPQPRAAGGSVPSSPSRTSQVQAAPVASLIPPWSPSRFFSRPTAPATSQPTGATTLQPTIQESSQPAPTATQPPSSLSEKEPKPAVSRPLSQVSDQPQKPDSDAIGGDAKLKSEEREGEKKAASVSDTPIKDLLPSAFQAKQKPKPEKEETFDKEAIYTTSSTAKPISTASSMHPNDRKISSKSTTQKPSTVVSEGERLPPHEEVRKDMFKYVQKLTTSYPVGEKPVSVITIAGGNEGASMHLGLHSAQKEGRAHIQRGYKLKPDESTELDAADGEGSSKLANRSENPITKENSPSRTYVNSNVQSVNNSMLFDNSITERNPGVQLVVSNKQEEPIKSNGKPEPLETRKAESNLTPAEKLTYEPTKDRRCLITGLFMEPSDSDPDPDPDPDTETAGKPRRHGYETGSGGETDKEKEIGVV